MVSIAKKAMVAGIGGIRIVKQHETRLIPMPEKSTISLLSWVLLPAPFGAARRLGSADSLAESWGRGAGTGKSPQLVPKDEEHCEAPNAEESVYTTPE
jgi:hypothetical protein